MRWYVKTHLTISHYLIIGAAIIAVCSSTEDGEAAPESGRSIGTSPSSIVAIEVYYESLCYDSIQFMKNQLVPTYQQLGNYMSVTFIPYGKASHEKTRDRNGIEKWQFSCQHGSSECYGNKAQACAINNILSNPDRSNKQQDLVNLVGCAMSARNPSNAVPRCLENMGIDANRRTLINDCIASEAGDNLLAAYGDRTHNVQPLITFVPTIVLNGVFSHDNQRNSLRNLKATICYYIPAESRPTACSG